MASRGTKTACHACKSSKEMGSEWLWIIRCSEWSAFAVFPGRCLSSLRLLWSWSYPPGLTTVAKQLRPSRLASEAAVSPTAQCRLHCQQLLAITCWIRWSCEQLLPAQAVDNKEMSEWFGSHRWLVISTTVKDSSRIAFQLFSQSSTEFEHHWKYRGQHCGLSHPENYHRKVKDITKPLCSWQLNLWPILDFIHRSTAGHKICLGARANRLKYTRCGQEWIITRHNWRFGWDQMLLFTSCLLSALSMWNPWQNLIQRGTSVTSQPISTRGRLHGHMVLTSSSQPMRASTFLDTLWKVSNKITMVGLKVGQIILSGKCCVHGTRSCLTFFSWLHRPMDLLGGSATQLVWSNFLPRFHLLSSAVQITDFWGIKRIQLETHKLPTSFWFDKIELHLVKHIYGPSDETESTRTKVLHHFGTT